MGMTGSGRPTPTQPPSPTPQPTPPMSGGKGAGRVSPTVESRPLFSNTARTGRVLTDTETGETIGTRVSPGVSSGGKGGARVQPTKVQPTQASLDNAFQQFKSEDSVPQPTTPQASLPEYQSVIKGFPQQSKDLLPEPKLAQQLSAPAATQEQAGTPNLVDEAPPGTVNPLSAPPPTPIRGGGKAGPTADRVAPVTPQPMPMTPPPAPMTPPPIPPGLDNPVFRRLGQRQVAQQPQQSITGMNTNTGSTNSMPAPQSAIFKQGGLIGLMRRR